MVSGKLKKIKICVLGANGQLGQEFRCIAPEFEFMSFHFYDKKSCDIIKKSDVAKAIASHDFDYLINCAAYTAVDRAEKEVEQCYAINTQACNILVDVLSDTKIKLIHFSSDYIYHTYSGFPIREEDSKSPKGIYAKSKYDGEMILRKSNIPVLILRTSWVISSFGNNFLKTMLRLGAEKNAISVVNDQFGAPTYARHLANGVLDIITATISDPSRLDSFNDTYNFANEGIVTWYDIAKQIMNESKLECKVNPISTEEYPTPARRPNWSVLSKHKIKETYSLEIPHWYIAVKDCLLAVKMDQT
ncbi:MAG: dTDP-4-dehydrorhamnose reductase [Saprospiraceae bacterium]|nr:dTDP-4-dehydrorhamnose reductase [Saprospiraceae bacterium]MBL0027483.1 dTDP-4-dehydrorhamnose reductase [Saprospiraceae bacterium]